MEDVLVHHAAAAAADHPAQRDPHHDLDAQHVRHGAGADGWRPRTVDGGPLLVRLQHDLPQPGPGGRKRPRRLPAADQPVADHGLPSPAEPGGAAMSATTGATRLARRLPGIRLRRKAKETYVRPKGGRGADVLNYVAFLAIFLFFGGPLLWILSLSIKTAAEVNDPSLALIPDEPTLDNYTQVLNSAQFPTFLTNSAKLSIGGSLGAMLVAAPAAYAFSRFKFRGKSSALVAILALQMIAPLVVAVPLYRYFARIDLLDSHF